MIFNEKKLTAMIVLNMYIVYIIKMCTNKKKYHLSGEESNHCRDILTGSSLEYLFSPSLSDTIAKFHLTFIFFKEFSQKLQKNILK